MESSTSITPEQLRTFLAVSRHLSYTKAAAELHLSQPAVWRQVQKLQRCLGVRLVEQFGKATHLTDAGRTLVHEGEALLGHLGRLAESVREHARGLRGELRIGASSTPGHHILPEILAHLHREHPELELRYEVENSARVEQKLLRNELDVGVVGGPVQSSALAAEEFALDRIVCYAAPGHPLARLRRIRAERLVREPCVMREDGSATRQLFESWLLAAGCRLERTIVVANPLVAAALVGAGIGFSFGSRLGLRRAGVEELAVEGFRIQRPITLAWHRAKHVSPAMAELIGLARRSRASPSARG